ncbi:NADH:flavin oxidoreductase [Planktomarina sp.]|nr:NADH:flavin oxidoreductase [Planktomarina sp.]MDA9100654.1 NADH:flavin oxidoreductase [Planktomarina sp.]
MHKDPLLQPFQLKHLTLKNRIMTTSHEPAYPEDGMPKERYRAYHEERAKGGIALAMTAGSSAVSKDSPPVFNNILAYKDEVVPWIRNLTDSCHEHGCAMMIQLTHLGRRTSWNKGDWLPSVSSTKHREPAHRSFPKLIEDWDIERIIGDFADAAERMQAGGMDGIELQVYGHLLDQFWSPLTNELSGPYGADTLENRLRFPLDVLSAIRKRVGHKFIIGFRYTADEMQSGGVTREEGIVISKKLEETGKLDFLNVVRGRIHTDPAMTEAIPVQGMPTGHQIDFAGSVKKVTNLPIFHASRIPDVATARHAISAGLLDMVGMTRAHIADPHIVQKIIEKREVDIRPCVGATYCLDRIYNSGEALCIHNAATGRELAMPHIVNFSNKIKKVVVIGAGPGGLEAARVASERGHAVTVLEAADQPGGQIRLTAQSPRRREMISIVDWRMQQCEKRGVRFQFNTYAEMSDVVALEPQVVVVATGGIPNMELFETKGELKNVSSAWDLISGDVKPAEHILIYDESGDHPGLQAAEIAANAGCKVEIMTPDRTVSPEIMAMNLVPYMRALQNKDVTFTVARRLLNLSQNGNKLRAEIGTDYSSLKTFLEYDQVILNYGTLPVDELYFQLKPFSRNEGAVDYEALILGKSQKLNKNTDGKFQLFRIGDAVSARNTHAAIYDALRFMKDI